MLEGYARDDRETVVKELVKAWDAFDREDYARRVLSYTLQRKPAAFLERLSSLDGLQYLTNLTKLYLFNCPRVSDLTPLADLTNLTKLYLFNCPQVSDLAPLAGLTTLTELDLSFSSQIRDWPLSINGTKNHAKEFVFLGMR